ncbi:hypothetical protein NSPZN2_100287 [Nitrospira defluvii]|uniref:Uncharacterized protein n=1 Tax=Nitrospira defluvii TaxID=330214 RepID=A0ABM8R2L1_9BACT|nr:hypothetical protein NSPZN2_100287 [Nitrospira defluvii]
MSKRLDHEKRLYSVTFQLSILGICYALNVCTRAFMGTNPQLNASEGNAHVHWSLPQCAVQRGEY